MDAAQFDRPGRCPGAKQRPEALENSSEISAGHANGKNIRRAGSSAAREASQKRDLPAAIIRQRA